MSCFIFIFQILFNMFKWSLVILGAPFSDKPISIQVTLRWGPGAHDWTRTPREYPQCKTQRPVAKYCALNVQPGGSLKLERRRSPEATRRWDGCSSPGAESHSPWEWPAPHWPDSEKWTLQLSRFFWAYGWVLDAGTSGIHPNWTTKSLISNIRHRDITKLKCPAEKMFIFSTIVCLPIYGDKLKYQPTYPCLAKLYPAKSKWHLATYVI